MCQESHDLWRGTERLILLCKEVFMSSVMKAEVYTQILQLFGVLESFPSYILPFVFFFVC